METYSESGLGRLEAAIAKQAVQDMYGIGDSAFTALALKMDRLRTATRKELGVSGGSEQDGYGVMVDRADGKVQPSLRTSARQVAAVFAPDGDDPALWVQRAVRNPNLSVAHWREVLKGKKNQPGVDEMRDIARLLRSGLTIKEVAHATGHSTRQVEPLSVVLGVAEWSKEREVRFATDCLAEGLDVHESYRRWQELVPEPHPDLKTWRRRYKEAAKVLGANDA